MGSLSTTTGAPTPAQPRPTCGASAARGAGTASAAAQPGQGLPARVLFGRGVAPEFLPAGAGQRWRFVAGFAWIDGAPVNAPAVWPMFPAWEASSPGEPASRAPTAARLNIRSVGDFAGRPAEILHTVRAVRGDRPSPDALGVTPLASRPSALAGRPPAGASEGRAV